MKIKTIEAALKLGIHPTHLLLHIASLDSTLTFTDIWPEIDKEWMETIASTGKHRQQPTETLSQNKTSSQPDSRFSKNVIHVLDKLSRQGKWGNVSVALDSLQNLTHVPKHDLEEVISDLRKASFLHHDGTGRGTISLNPAMRKEIEKLLKQ